MSKKKRKKPFVAIAAKWRKLPPTPEAHKKLIEARDALG